MTWVLNRVYQAAEQNSCENFEKRYLQNEPKWHGKLHPKR